MTTLALLTAEYRSDYVKLMEMDLDEQTLSDTLESISGDIEIKALNVAMMARMFEADAAACKAWAKDATERAKAIEARAERLRDYLAQNLLACGITRVDGPGVAISFRKSSAVVIDGVDLLPSEFMRQPEAPPPAPDKTLIAAAFKAGREVPGAHLEHRQSLQIK